MFDEAEDVFDDNGAQFGRKSAANSHKSWINRALEENTVPTLWLSNHVGCMDPAFVRRFDMMIELPIPPKYQRERIIEQNGDGLLCRATVSRMAESEQLAAAVVARASTVVRCVRVELGDAAGAAIELLVNNTLEAQGHKAVRRHNDPDYLPETYAGKTAYGRWLAEHLKRPLSVKRASDLISKWVGGTERNIAAAFKSAEQENTVLLIDEVDSFLQDRRSAGHTWEVSAVKEIACGLDLLGNLTPGDFAAVARQHRFRRISCAVGFIDALAAESAIKGPSPRHMGFI